MELKTEAMTVVLTNEADDSREYTIRADVQVRDGKFVSAGNGQVFDKVNNNGMYIVYFNVGNDGSGTHVAPTTKYDAPLAANVSLNNFCPGVAPNRDIVREFYRFYSTSVFRRVLNALMRWRYIIFGR